MRDKRLFIGFAVDSAYESLLKALDPKILHYYLNDVEGDLLHEVSYKGCRYIGKFIEEPAFIVDLSLLENNIYSILRRIISEYSYEKVPLRVFPVESSDE